MVVLIIMIIIINLFFYIEYILQIRKAIIRMKCEIGNYSALINKSTVNIYVYIYIYANY